MDWWRASSNSESPVKTTASQAARRRTVRSAAGSLALVTLLGGLVLVPRSSGQAAGPQAEPNSRAVPDAGSSPSGSTPAQIQAAYALSTSPYAGAGQTIAIVDSYDDPNVVAELATFDTAFNLPLCGDGCFTKVDQNGGISIPAPAPSNWALEIAMDVEWAHAIAPGAHILLVEAASGGIDDLLAAERYAGAHAGYVSNSWGYPEFAGETVDASAFGVPGVSYFASVDDAPDKTQYPATAPSVVAVGGAELTASGTIPWSNGGGGCSVYEQASSSQAVAASQAGCAGLQSTPAVSADASGIPVFGESSWWNAGGTSFATVLWAAAAADSGQVVTNEAISSGSIPLSQVIGGTLLKTGFGNLSTIPRTVGEFSNMVTGAMQVTILS